MTTRQAQISQWHINSAHYLESWSDARAYDGTVTVIQPMIDPLYGGHSAHEIVQSLLDDPHVSPYDAVRETWKDTDCREGHDFEFGWRKALHDGFIADTAFSPKGGGGKASIPAPASAGSADSMKSSSAPIRMSTTDVTQTSAGCRKCLGR